LTLSVLGCSNKKEPEKSVIIAGKILNHENHPDDYTIKILEQNLVNSLGVFHTVFIGNDGTFKIKFPKSFSNDLYLNFGQLVTVFVAPGDSIFIEMDADDFLNPQNNRYEQKSLIFSGSNRRINEEINLFHSLIRKSTKSQEVSDNEKKMLPDEYLDFLNKWKSEQNQILDSLIQTKRFSNEFINWAKLSIDYRFGSSLFHYTWANPYANHIGDGNITVIDIPKSYYQSINKVAIDNEKAIISSAYVRFLHEYYSTNTYYRSDFRKMQIKYSGNFSKSDSFQVVFENLLHNIDSEYHGIASEILLSQNLYDLLDGYNRVDIFEELYPRYKTKLRSILRVIIDDKYAELKSKAANPSKQESGMETLRTNVLNEIIAKNKGKIIYIDFWATWCGPCLKELEYSKKLTETFEGKNVEFVYMCVKSEKENWQDKIREYKLSGSQYLLNDSEYDVLSQKFQITGIPHYVLINKDGHIINDHAPTPSSGKELANLIKKYLN
jgi:thiol-disulfide isomerase/thioredoxin